MKTDRTVVITGAAGGMGAVFVRRFLDNGDLVIATDAAADSLAALADSMNSARLRIRAADITDEADTKALAELARQATGRVDVLVNVAGYFPVQPFLEMSAADWRKIIDINLTGTALMCQAMLPLLTGRGWGRIINIGSASIYAGVPGQAHYVAAKAGLIGLSAAWRGSSAAKACASTSWRPASPSPPPPRRRFRSRFRTPPSRVGA
ncbi:MAG: SDR family NAD(P)-dependent oxidoreductase [Caulobacteraceae bacterium]|nr:SDR family NAD(P)-dependent oxidoreductase [Caulobacteraceae bacterium]